MLFLAAVGLLSHFRSRFPIRSPHFIEKKEQQQTSSLIHLSFLPRTAHVRAREPRRTLLFIVTVAAKKKTLFCTMLLSAPTTEMQLSFPFHPSMLLPCLPLFICIVLSFLSWAVEWKPWRESRAAEVRRRGDKEAVRAPPVVLCILSRLCFTRGLLWMFCAR